MENLEKFKDFDYKKIDPKIFKANDIRGVYPTEINENVAFWIGKAFSHFIKTEEVGVAKDIRLSSPSLSKAVEMGLISENKKVIDFGTIPTPVAYFAVSHLNLGGAAIITASHNPKEWNGIKLCIENSRLLGSEFNYSTFIKILDSGEGAEAGKEESEKADEEWGKGDKKGKSKKAKKIVKKEKEIWKIYRGYILSFFKDLKDLRIGLDPGNGTWSRKAEPLLEEAGLKVIAINSKPDGTFPSRSPEPTPESISSLINLVKEESLDFGVAFDGDGDRGVFVDDSGNVARGDTILALMVKHFLKAKEKVVYEVSCSKVVEDMIKSKGGIGILSRTGHKFIVDEMLKNSATLGGEVSSHLYFKEVYGLDDPLFATLKLSKIISDSNLSLSQLIKELPTYYTLRQNFAVSEGAKTAIIKELENNFKALGYKVVTIDGVKVVFDDGWFLFRASNTEALIRLSVEANSSRRLEDLSQFAGEAFNKAVRKLS